MSLFVLLVYSPPSPPPDDVEVIEVDIDHPERNREVKVVHFRDANKNGILHNGFEILMEGDLRDMLDDKYSAKMVQENEILISMPSASHSWLYEPCNFFDKCEAFGIGCARSLEAHNVARNDILKKKDRLTKQLLLRFPVPIILSNRHYSPNTADNDLEFEVVPFETSFLRMGKTFTSTISTIFWKIAVYEENLRVVENNDVKGKKGEARLAERFASMSTSAD
jgi:hypothetical protein